MTSALIVDQINTTAGIPYSSAAPQSIAACGDSVIAGSVPGGSVYRQSARRIGLFYKTVGVFAVAGNRTDQISSQIPIASAAGANICVINGGINDIVQSVAEATLRTNLIANWSGCRLAGIEPIDVGLPPTNTSGNVARYVSNEVWRSLYCYKYNIRHVDLWTPLATSTGAFRAGLNADAIHLNSAGALAAEPALSGLVGSRTSRSYPLLAMTDTGSHAGTFVNNAISFSGGATPTGWFTSGTGGTLSVQTADANDLGAWLRCTCVAAVSAGFTPTAVTLASLGWSIGDKIAVGFKIRWADTAQALAVSCYLGGVSGVAPYQPLFAETGGAAGDAIYSYTEVTFTGGTVINLMWFASGTGYFEINRPTVVNLTQLGLA